MPFPVLTKDREKELVANHKGRFDPDRYKKAIELINSLGSSLHRPVDIQKWFKTSLTGDKLANSDDFPIWLVEGLLKDKLAVKDEVDKGTKAKLKKHLKDKYKSWVNKKTKILWTDAEFDDRFTTLLETDSKSGKSGDDKKAENVKEGRYKLLAEDFDFHINYTSDELMKLKKDNVEPITKSQALAIAIYSSSQYTNMNALSRGNLNGKTDVKMGDPIDIAFTSYSSIGIKKLGKIKAFHKNIVRQQISGVSDIVKAAGGRKKYLRRDLSLTDKDILAIFNWIKNEDDHIKNNWTQKKSETDPTKTYYAPQKPLVFRDKGFMSSTAVLQGVDPFNKGNNVAYFIELPDIHAPFPAADIADLSCYPKEKEILWAPATDFLVSKIIDERPTTKYPDGDWRSDTFKGEETKKLWVFLRPVTALDRFPYMSLSHVEAWVSNNLTGDKIVDTDKFKCWKEDKAFVDQKPKPDKDALKTHLNAKYKGWKLEETFDDTFDKIWAVSKDERNAIVGKDYQNHINKYATSIEYTTGVTKDYALAVAIYSSSEYGKMNLLGRGGEGKPEWHADPIHLWLTAKAAVGINTIGPLQSWQTDTPPQNALVTATKMYTDINIRTEVKASLEKAGFKPFARRDEGHFPKDLADGLKNKKAGEIIKPNFLWSTTKKLEGVAPFNEGSNVAWFIDVSEASPEAAMNIAKVSAYPTEAEILWRFRQDFEVVHVEDTRDASDTYPTDDKDKDFRYDWGGEPKVSDTKKVFVYLKAKPFKLDLYPTPKL